MKREEAELLEEYVNLTAKLQHPGQTGGRTVSESTVEEKFTRRALSKSGSCKVNRERVEYMVIFLQWLLS